MTTFLSNIPTPEETPGVHRSSRVKFQTKPDYIPSMSGNNYEKVNTQVKCVETLHPYAHIFLCLKLIEEVPEATAFIMTQLFLKSGMKRWKVKGQESAKSNMKQMYFRDTYKPKHYIYMNEDQNNSILESHMFLKENRYGTIKGRTVEGVNKQRGFITKEYYSSLTVSTESVLLSCIIDSEDKRDFAIIDIPNASI